MEVTVDASGLSNLEAFFKELSTFDQRKIFMAAYRKAVKPLIAAAKANVPKRTGKLRDSIGTVEVPNEIAILVGTKLAGAKKGWYGHLIEDGTKPRMRRKRKDASTGMLIGTHFFEKAYDATEDEVVGSVQESYYQAIENAVIKYDRKTKK